MDEPPSKKYKQTQITFFKRTPSSSTSTGVGESADKETSEITAALSVSVQTASATSVSIASTSPDISNCVIESPMTKTAGSYVRDNGDTERKQKYVGTLLISAANVDQIGEELFAALYASPCQKACLTRTRQDKAAAAGDVSRPTAETPLERSFRFANSELEKKTAKMILHVRNDAKKGTLSAWSFPLRWVASIIGDRTELNEKHERFLPTKTDLQYIILTGTAISY